MPAGGSLDAVAAMARHRVAPGIIISLELDAAKPATAEQEEIVAFCRREPGVLLGLTQERVRAPANRARPEALAHLSDPELFRRVYDDCGRGAESHVLLASHRARVEWQIARIGELDSVIDIGCADGLVLEKIAAKTRGRLLGLDIAESHVTYNRGAYTHQADWLVADGATLPVRDNAFDVAVLGEILEHVIDPAAVVAEAERVVKPGGRVIVSTPIEGMALDQHGAEHRDGLHGFPVDLHVREFDPGVELRGRTNLELAQSFILTLTGQIVPGFYLASYLV